MLGPEIQFSTVSNWIGDQLYHLWDEGLSKRGSSIVPLSQRSDELLNAINKAAAGQMCASRTGRRWSCPPWPHPPQRKQRDWQTESAFKIGNAAYGALNIMSNTKKKLNNGHYTWIRQEKCDISLVFMASARWRSRIHEHLGDGNHCEGRGVAWHKVERVIALLSRSEIMKGITVRHPVALGSE